MAGERAAVWKENSGGSTGVGTALDRIPVLNVVDPESGSTCVRSSAVKQHALESV